MNESKTSTVVQIRPARMNEATIVKLLSIICNAIVLIMLTVSRYYNELDLFLKILAIAGLCFSAIALLIHVLNIQAILTKSFWIIFEFCGCLTLACLFGVSIGLRIQESVWKLSAVAVIFGSFSMVTYAYDAITRRSSIRCSSPVTVIV